MRKATVKKIRNSQIPMLPMIQIFKLNCLIFTKEMMNNNINKIEEHKIRFAGRWTLTNVQ